MFNPNFSVQVEHSEYLKFEELKEFKKLHGHVSPPQKEPSIGNWVINQRANYSKNKLSKERINKLENQIKEKKSFLCIGLDIDLEKIPNHLKEKEDPIFSFAKDIIDSTNKFAVAYKPNIAFFEAYGISGWKSLEKIIRKKITFFITKKYI